MRTGLLSLGKFALALWTVFVMTLTTPLSALDWNGTSGAGGGSGNWNTTDASWYNGTGAVVWSNGGSAVFGGTQDAVKEGTVTINASGLSLSTLTFLSALNNGYLLQGDGTPRSVTFSGAITTASGAKAALGSNLTLSRSGEIQLLGGGSLTLEGATMSNTSGLVTLQDGLLVEVKSASNFTSADSLVVGNFVNTSYSGTATLVVSGGTVLAGTGSSGSRNLVIGGTNGNAVVTITGGLLTVSAGASNGLAFYNSGGTAVFNLDGGVVTAPQVKKNVAGGTSTVFSFNGGTLKANKSNTSFMASHGELTALVKAGGAIIDSAGFDITIGENLETDPALSGSADGGLTKRGAGTLSLRGTNTYTGGTVVEAGILDFTASTQLGAASTDPSKLMLNGGTLQFSHTANLEITRGITLGTNGGAISVSQATGRTLTVAGIITGTGSLTKTGQGILISTQNNSYTGATILQAGVFQTSTFDSLGDSSDASANFVLDGGAFHHTGNGVATSRGLTVTANGGTLMGTGTNAWRVGGVVTGSGTLKIAGSVYLSGINSTFTGDIEILSGEFLVRRAASLGTTAGKVIVHNGAVFGLDQNGTGGGGNSVSDNDYKDDLLLKDGAMLRNRGDNTGIANDTDSVYSGKVTLESGTAQFDVRSLALSITGQIMGAGGLNKTSAGDLSLAAANSFTGKTTVTSGKLALVSTGTIDDSPWIEIKAGATFDVTAKTSGHSLVGSQVLSGTGTIAGNLIAAGNSVLKPGSSTSATTVGEAGDQTGTLTFQNNLTLGGGASPRVLFQLGGSADYDNIQIGGALTVADSTRFKVEWTGGFMAQEGDVFDLLNWSGSLVTWGNFNPGSEDFLDLPDFTPESGLYWVTQNFLSQGTISVAPEPGRSLLLMLGLAAASTRRRRRKTRPI